MDINIGDEYKNYWETNMYLPQELDMSYMDDLFSGYYDSSSPDGAQSSITSSKNIVSERNRRRKLNERLYALRSVVPNITKMDKASIIKDAIEYIKTLHEEEKRIKEEISELELLGSSNSPGTIFEFDQEATTTFCSKPKRSKLEDQFLYDCCEGSKPISSPLDVLELRVSNMGEKTMVISLTCNKRRDTMVKLCQIFESLKLKIITANITALSGLLFKTVFLEADEEEKDMLRSQIEAAITALNNDPDSPMSI